MYKNIDEFARSYIPCGKEKELERMALRHFIWDNCDKHNGTAIINALARSGIDTIPKLYETNGEGLEKVRCLGTTRISKVKELIRIIHDSIEE